MTDAARTGKDRVLRGNAEAPEVCAERARRFGWWYFAEHYLRQLYRYGWPLTVSDIGQPLLYFLAMGVGLGTLVDGSAGTVEGVRYLTFIAPALLVAISTQSCASELTYPVMSGFRWQRFYWGTAATPVAPWQIALGHALAVSLRLVFQASVVIALMVIFGVPIRGTVLALLLIGPAAALAFGLNLQAYAATLDSEGAEFSLVQRFLIMPLFLLSGTFFPLSVLPTAAQWLGWLSPLWHGAELARWAAYGKPLSGALLTAHAAYLLACLVIGVALVARNYRRRLRS
ncbi:MAG: ABC transporter permease [Bowdeniella nasicola]|nr:ABC transporter permease [Bowdeniella nasicola]